MLALWVMVGLFDGASVASGPVPPTPPSIPTYSGGGGGGGGATIVYERPRDWKSRDGFDRRLEATLQGHLSRIGQTFAESDSRQAQRIARKLAAYGGELGQVASLQRELSKLEAERRAREAASERDELEREVALIQAVIELRAFLADEADALDAIEAIEQMEARLVLAAAGVTVH